MAFFTDDVLINFNEHINKHINGDTDLDQNKPTFLQKNKLALLNKDGVMDWLLLTRPIGSTSRPRKAKQTPLPPSEISMDFSLIQLDQFVTRLTEEQCQKKIGYGYGKQSVTNSISKDKYDILLVVTDTHKNVPQSEYTPEQYIKFKMKQVKGFMIVEKGECKKYSDLYSVRLICSNAKQGTLLMGMYLYTLLTTQTGDNQTGILELAGGYKNTPGLCTYTKFGFSQDDDLNGKNCFSDFENNLSMSVKLYDSNVTKDDIIQVILRKKNKLNIVAPNDTELCTTYKPDDFLQEHLQTKLAKLIEDKRINNFLPNELKSKVNYDSDINLTKDWITREKHKKKKIVLGDASVDEVSDNTSCVGNNCSISGGKQTNRKRKGCKRTTSKRKACKRTTRKNRY